MIDITGDTHIPIDIHKLASRNYPESKEMTKNDYVIITGDFGGVWDGSSEDEYWRKWLDKKPFTTLFADGNHENFDLLAKYPVVDFMGGKAHKISDSIYHLMRGYVFDIEGKSFFVMGGAASHDKEYREENISWWQEEMPDEEEMKRGLENLEKRGFEVDYIISHCAPDHIQDIVCYYREQLRGSTTVYAKDSLTGYLQQVMDRCSFKKWFFGHYHLDREINDQFRALYYDIIRLD